MAFEMTRKQILTCLARNADPSFPGPGCGLYCGMGAPVGACCGIVGEPRQYENYQQLLRHPSVPADPAAPLIDALELYKDPEYEDWDDDELARIFRDTYDLVMKYLPEEDKGYAVETT